MRTSSRNERVTDVFLERCVFTFFEKKRKQHHTLHHKSC